MRDMNSESGRNAHERRIEGRHVLIIFLAFFGVVFAVNGYFLVTALRTHTGVVAVEPYRKGLAYNTRIAADERQSQLGWHDELTVDREGTIAVTLIGPDGQSVRGLTITSTIGRPSTSAHDRQVTLAEQVTGKHVGNTAALPSGTWIIVIEARSSADSEPLFRARRRLWLKS